jgi:hypothetical protein
MAVGYQWCKTYKEPLFQALCHVFHMKSSIFYVLSSRQKHSILTKTVASNGKHMAVIGVSSRSKPLNPFVWCSKQELPLRK